MKVRCVEDDPTLSLLILRLLARVGIEVDCYRRIKDVPDDWEGINAALVDMILPGPAGTVLLRHLKEQHPEVRRVLMSGWDPAIRAEPDLQGIAHAFLWKPFDATALYRALRIPSEGSSLALDSGAQWLALADEHGEELRGTRTPLGRATSILFGTGEEVVDWRRLKDEGKA